MKVVIVGGTGFVGQGILQVLVKDKTLELYSLSRGGKRPDSVAGVIYQRVDLERPNAWQTLLKEADWVMDCVGILWPDRKKQLNYQNASIKPAKKIIATIKTSETKFLFISANVGLPAYLRAKRTVEKYAHQVLGKRAYVVYPGLIYDRTKKSTYYLGKILHVIAFLPGLKKYRPVKRKILAQAIEKILQGKTSEFERSCK